MTQHACACGYQAESPDDLTVHFGEMFIPDNDLGPDGQVHAEIVRDASAPATPGTLRCQCGFTSSVSDFDQHLVTIFTPPDHIGRDGSKHTPAPGLA